MVISIDRPSDTECLPRPFKSNGHLPVFGIVDDHARYLQRMVKVILSMQKAGQRTVFSKELKTTYFCLFQPLNKPFILSVLWHLPVLCDRLQAGLDLRQFVR
jgi:hypothetical protein